MYHVFIQNERSNSIRASVYSQGIKTSDTAFLLCQTSVWLPVQSSGCVLLWHFERFKTEKTPRNHARIVVFPKDMPQLALGDGQTA